ncbi:MAG: hypothetical protein H5U36_08805 [Candidatus Caldatribacterium sp.]|nr:hypothetical protein [Candidatus Caldatribacterium sp.]
MFHDFLSNFAMVVFIGGLVAEGLLSPGFASFALLAFIFFRAIARAIGGVSAFVYYLFTLPFYSLIALLIFLRVGWRGVLEGQWQEIGSILLRVWLTGFGMIIVNILRLFGKGYIALPWVIFFVVTLWICQRIGLNRGSVFVYYTIFSILAPFFTLAIFLATLSTKTSPREVFAVLIALIALFLMLEGLYLMIYGTFSPPGGRKK